MTFKICSHDERHNSKIELNNSLFAKKENRASHLTMKMTAKS